MESLSNTKDRRGGSPGKLFAAVAILVAGVFLYRASTGTSAVTEETAAPSDALPAPPEGPLALLGVSELVHAVPFALADAYTHRYRSESPPVSSGWLVVLRVKPDLVTPTNDFQPVLYAGLESGTQTIERINQGHLDGLTVAILPETGEQGSASLADVPIWFGDKELPERLTTEAIAYQRERAEDAGVFRVAKAAWAKVGEANERRVMQDRTALEEFAAELILEYAPNESYVAEGILQTR